MASCQIIMWPRVDPELLKGLPPIHRAVVKALGIGRASKFLADYGGVDQMMPKHKPCMWGLTEAETERLRETLAPHVDATGRVTLPKVDKLYKQARNADIQAQHITAGQSLRSLAREHHLTSRQVRNICREDDQLDLF